MAKKGPLGPDLIREIWKRSVPRVRLYRLPELPGRVAWIFPFLRERLPERLQPGYLKRRAAERVWGAPAPAPVPPAEAETPPVAGLHLEAPALELFPPLPGASQLQGRKGRYQIQQDIGQRNLGRLYQAQQVLENRSVVIKEYALPGSRFSAGEIRQRQGAFMRLAGMKLADGRIQDARLIQPWDAIVDSRQPRCYLVTLGKFGALPSLRDHLGQFGPLGEPQGRSLLNQVLQTLEFLHGQKYRLPAGQVTVGLPHGNLNLDSLLIAAQERGFFVYVCDLALWENLFDPTQLISDNPDPQQDLRALGSTAILAMTGHSSLEEAPETALETAPLSAPLRSYLERLSGAGVPFASAAAARQALLQLPVPQPPALAPRQAASKPVPKPRKRRRTWLLAAAVMLGLLSALALAWWLRAPSSAVAQPDPLVCCLEDVPGIPRQQGTYGALDGSSWDYVWQQPGLINQRQTLEAILQQRQPDLRLRYVPVPAIAPVESAQEVLERVRSQQVNFAVSSLSVSQTPELQAQTIAYDGLAVFVAFSSERRQQSLPAALGGQISFEQLRQLYLGEITSWSELNSRLPDLPVQLYVPDDPEAVRIFEQQVLQTPAAISRFRQRQASPEDLTAAMPALPTFELLQAVIQDFENQGVGAIAFAPLSQIFGQCAVYPLALQADVADDAVQPLAQGDSEITPQTNLCDDKGSYFPNVQAFTRSRYPLAYPLSVVYRRDNSQIPFGRKFAELFQTEEGQRLLSTAGLVPIQAFETGE